MNFIHVHGKKYSNYFTSCSRQVIGLAVQKRKASACVRTCVRTCVRVCVRMCMCACVRVYIIHLMFTATTDELRQFIRAELALCILLLRFHVVMTGLV